MKERRKKQNKIVERKKNSININMEKSPPRSYKKQQKNLNELTNQELKRKIIFNTKNFK
jgi:hypothetical protein